MVGDHLFFFFFQLIDVTIINVVQIIVSDYVISQNFDPFINVDVSIFFDTIDINKIDRLHKNEELFEIQTSEFNIVFHLTKNGINDLTVQFLRRAFWIFDSFS